MAAVGGWTRVSVYFSKSHRGLSTQPVRPHVPSMNVPVKAANVTPILQMKMVRLREGTWLIHVAELGLMGGPGPLLGSFSLPANSLEIQMEL